MTIAVVLKGYPRLSESFIAQELYSLEQMGFDLILYSLRQPTDELTHAIHKFIKAPVRYLPEYVHDDLKRVWRAWIRQRKQPFYKKARNLWLKDLKRDLSRNRFRRFAQALVLADEMPASIHFIYNHFLHTPTSVGRYAAVLRGLPWGASGHAKDIWTNDAWDLQQKLDEANWVVTCTQAGADYLKSLAQDHNKIHLVYHGYDAGRFPPPDPLRTYDNNGQDLTKPVIILTVGRTVDKKGFDILLKALAQIPSSIAWRLKHIGKGPLLADLQQQAQDLGIAKKIEFLGALNHDGVLAWYRQADLFVLPCRISEDGDRDGLPNVLLEAQSQQLPCISTIISGVPELIDHPLTGLLVPPNDDKALLEAMIRLITHPDERTLMGEAGMQKAKRFFSHQAGIVKLGALLKPYDQRNL